MLQEEHSVYTSYQQQPSYAPPTSVGVVDRYPDSPASPWQNASQPPVYPSVQPAAPTPPPSRRSGRTGATVAITLLLAIIFGVGVFAAGWQFSSNAQHTATTSGTTASSTTVNNATIQTQQEAAIAKIEPSVVELSVTTARGQQIGSGVIIDANGDIVTNNHVVSGAQTINVTLNSGSTIQARLVGNDTADDLAVVRITPFAHMVVAQIADSSKLTVGQEVLAIGNPLGITETATRGIVSALNRSVTESSGTTIANAIQTDASINPGNSGGALVNLQGQLIGIPTLTAINSETNTPANGIGFAIPSNLVTTALHQLV